ncbi:PREDICTED: sushi, von Willebrand factor type A, EGF and pentraxin domain-containing protein 1-like [Branchiostoma belcheri]|uniref:Sushi, von Willebrand factor type A, EGF and pentraxin domain-containing protein 1-like n=1 Tax=Branchiostoma belcheri TaxID=7741 RepID=A0A6P5A1E3_BRABE|nr:PREDICTED: sushi, von Willebrand factor type A, EGF and pentraxin domain-containing protein 1-like [Branchiostoma belcheri]
MLDYADLDGCVAPYKHGDECTYHCFDGFCPDPDGGTGDMATCDDGVWVWNNPPPIECKMDCGPPPMLDYADLDGCVAPFKHGDECTYHCFDGFCPDPDGGTGDMVTCDDGIWVWNNPPPIECKMDCGPPPMLDYADLDGCVAPFKHGDECTYHCFAGFCPDPDGGTGDMVTCDDGVWVWNNPPPIECKMDCGPPPMLANTNRGGCVGPFKHGDKCTYTCIAGFCPDPDGGTGDMVTCDDGNWVWNNFPMVCKQECGAPPVLANTIRGGCLAPFKHGEVCTYTCIAGFCPDPDGGAGDMVICNNGIWFWNNPPPMECKKDCDPPPTPDCASILFCNPPGPPYKHGANCLYDCDAGSTEVGGNDMLTCNDGFWIGVPLDCKKDCVAPPMPDCATVAGCIAPYTHGEVCNYQCDFWCYEFLGDNLLTCIDGVWIGTPLVCLLYCPAPPLPLDTIRSLCVAPYTHGEMCDYDCKPGYSKTGGDDMLTCNNGVWDGDELECKEDCEPPPEPEDRDLINCDPTGPPAIYPHGTGCYYECAEGYTYDSGNDTLTCNNGEWEESDEPLYCKPNCEEPTAPANTVLDSCTPPAPPYYHGAECTFKCAVGYTKVSGGDNMMTCRGGTWLLVGEQLLCAPSEYLAIAARKVTVSNLKCAQS